MPLFQRLCLLPVLLMLLALPAMGKTAPDGPEVALRTLANGLQVVAIPDHRAPVVTHMVWYKAGSADEPRGKSGIAHFLEHLMFKGTKKVPAGEFSRKVAEIGGQENAFTSYDFTAYYQKVSPDALEMVMGYEADRMENLVLAEDVIETEKKVILEERRERVDSSPGAILDEAADAALFVNHPYGTPVIGWQHEMLALTRDDAIAFYDRFYSPNNAVLVVAGDVDPKTVFALAEKIYGGVTRRVAEIDHQRAAEPEPAVSRSLEYFDERVTTPSFERTYLVPSYMSAEPGEAEALDLLSAVLGGSSSARLYRKLVTGNEKAISAGAWYQGTARNLGKFGFYGRPRGDTALDEIEAAIDAEIADIIENGVTQEELDRQRNALVKSVIFERDSQTTLAQLYGTMLALDGTIEDIADWPERLGRVTVDDVRDVARKYLKKPRSVTTYLRPAS
ncbi:MAG: insulinase family protein [Nitratireductor sp.]|nr:insulinase family protein [Nitratireductor sp.]